jgi:hypothetical protein
MLRPVYGNVARRFNPQLHPVPPDCEHFQPHVLANPHFLLALARDDQHCVPP